MNKDHFKVIAALALIGAAAIGALAVTKDASGGGRGSGNANAVPPGRSPAQIRIAQGQAQMRSADLRLTQATAARQAAENQVALAASEIYAIDQAAQQAAARVQFAGAMLRVKEDVYEADRAFENNIAQNLPWARTPGNSSGSHNEVMQAGQNVMAAQFQSQQELQTLRVKRAQAEVRLSDARLAAENAQAQVQVAQNDLASAEAQLALLLAQVTP